MEGECSNITCTGNSYYYYDIRASTNEIFNTQPTNYPTYTDNNFWGWGVYKSATSYV